MFSSERLYLNATQCVRCSCMHVYLSAQNCSDQSTCRAGVHQLLERTSDHTRVNNGWFCSPSPTVAISWRCSGPFPYVPVHLLRGSSTHLNIPRHPLNAFTIGVAPSKILATTLRLLHFVCITANPGIMSVRWKESGTLLTYLIIAWAVSLPAQPTPRLPGAYWICLYHGLTRVPC